MNQTVGRPVSLEDLLCHELCSRDNIVFQKLSPVQGNNYRCEACLDILECPRCE